MAKFAFRNPAFAEHAQGGVAAAQNVSAQQLDEIYNRASAPVEGEVMTYEDTIAKTVGAFAIMLVGAAVGWFLAPAMPLLWIGAALVGLVLGLVNSFKKEPSPPLILAYYVPDVQHALLRTACRTSLTFTVETSCRLLTFFRTDS